MPPVIVTSESVIFALFAIVTVPLVELKGVNPYAALTRKLGWSGSSLKP